MGVQLMRNAFRQRDTVPKDGGCMRSISNALTTTVCCAGLLAARLTAVDAQVVADVANATGVRLHVVAENSDPVLRIVIPGQPISDRSIEVLFPEHVTAIARGS